MRHEFSRLTKRLAAVRADGHCQICGHVLRPGRFVYDHIDPDWFSGCNDISNCQVICLLCDKDKTAADQAAIAKSKRIIDKQTKAKTSRHPLPFGKNDWRKKKIGGQVVDRRTGRPV